MLASRVQADEPPVINMTPMVDVILCLLVFFMAATRLYDWDESEFVVNVPEVTEAAPATAAPDDLVLTVIKRGIVSVGESTYNLDQLVTLAERGARPIRQSGRRDPRRRVAHLPRPGRCAVGLRRSRHPQRAAARSVARPTVERHRDRSISRNRELTPSQPP